MVYRDSDDLMELQRDAGARFLIVTGVGLVLTLGVWGLWKLRAFAFSPSTRTRSTIQRNWPRETEKGTYVIDGIRGLIWFVGVGASLMLLPTGIWVGDWWVKVPALTVVWIAGVYWLSRHLRLPWPTRFDVPLSRLPLSAAYSLRWAGLAAGVLGTFLLLSFQLTLLFMQVGHTITWYDWIRGRMESSRGLGQYDLAGYPQPWGVLPSIGLDLSGARLVEVILFYVAGVLVIVFLFLWLNAVIRRLFAQEVEDPEPLAAVDETVLVKRAQAACKSGSPLCRLLVLCHPRSGTSAAIRHMTERGDASKTAKLSVVDLASITVHETREPGRDLTRWAQQHDVLVFDNLEVRIDETEERRRKLLLLEASVYSNKPGVFLFSSVDPVMFVQSLADQKPDDDSLRAELNRWTRVFSSFEVKGFRAAEDEDWSFETPLTRKTPLTRLEKYCRRRCASEADMAEFREIFKSEFTGTAFLRHLAATIDLRRVNFSSPIVFESSLISVIRENADGYFRMLWITNTRDERIALYQLAKDDWVNPLGKVALSHLMRKELITRASRSGKTGAYRLLSESFRQFVLEALDASDRRVWAEEQKVSMWYSLRAALVLAVALCGFWFVYVNRDSFDLYFSYAAAAATGGFALLRGLLQIFRKDDQKAAGLLGAGKGFGGWV